MGRMKSIMQNSLLIILSLTFALFISEFVLRFIFDPVNFLQPEVVEDNNLGYVIKAGSAGHDVWGFRNRVLPQKVDVLAIGDSQTYGVSATSDNSWPAWLAKMTGKSVYNMGVSGYGPVQYKYLYETLGITLKPDMVIVGLYWGNDFFDVKEMVSGFEKWHYLSKKYPSLAQGYTGSYTVNSGKTDPRFLGGIRNWLSSHSMFYRVLYYSLESTIVRKIHELQLKKSVADTPDKVKEIRYGNGKVTGVAPWIRLLALDIENKQIMDAFELSLSLLNELNDLCLKNGTLFSVLIIPTKELVFSRYYSSENDDDTFHQVVANELILRNRAIDFFQKNKIDYIDSLTNLRNELPNNVIYHENTNGHPNKNGYRAIANAVASHLNLRQFDKPENQTLTRENVR